MHSHRAPLRLSFLVKLSCAWLLLGAIARAQFTYSEDFKNSTAAGWILNPAGNSTPNVTLTSGTAVRTGDPESGTIDPAGAGWLRLTNNTLNTHNAVYFDTPIPSAGNSVTIQFGANLWGGNNFAGTGADGLTFFLYDASKTFQVGADGGSLGFAQKTGVNGLNGGFVAVALDAYGNFSVAAEGRVGGTASLQPNSIAVRGPGQGTTGYNYLAGTGNRDLTDTGSPTTLDAGDGTVPALPYTMAFATATSRPNQSTQYRNVSITINESSQLLVSMQFGEDGLWYNLLNVDLSSFVRPEQLKMGFSAGTGSGTIITEVGGLLRIEATAGSGNFVWDNRNGPSDSGGGNSVWGTGASDPLNWAGQTNPTPRSNVIFNSTYVSTAQNIDVTGSDKVVTNLYFSGANGYTLGTTEARKLIFDSVTAGGLTAINLTNDAGGNTSHTLNLAVQMNRNLDINNNINPTAGTFTVSGNIDNGGNSLALKGTGNTTLSGVISGTGNLLKADSGTTTLSGANTYSGGTTVSGGTLRLENASALGATSGAATVADGATLALASGGSTTFGANALTLNGAGVDSLGALRNVAGNNTWTGTVALATNSSIGAATGTDLTVSGIVSGTGTLTKVGDGVLTLSGTNTYSGGTQINAGTVSVAANSGLGATASSLALNGGTLRSTATFSLDPARAVSLGAAGGTFETSSGTTLTYNGAIAGSGALNKTGTGTLSLGGSSTYNGATNINAGTLALATTNALPTATAVTVASGATFNVNSQNTTIGSLAGAGNTTLGTGNILTLGGAASTTYSGVMSGSGGLTQAGTGVLTMSGANTFTGNLTISSGTVALGAANVFSDSATLRLNGGTFSTAGYSDRFSSLSLLNTSTIDFNSMAGLLTFGTGSRTSGGLTISNWAGSPTGGGASRLLVDSLTAFDTTFLNNITFAGYGTGAQIISLGGGAFEVVPVTGSSYTWGFDTGGNWSAANWAGGTNNPGGVGTTTVFGSAITANRTVTLDAARTVGYLVFNDNNQYTLAGSQTLTLQASGGSSQINVSGGGSARIEAPLALANDLVVNQNSAGATLEITGTVSGTNRNLTVGGSDATIISGAIQTGTGSLTKLGTGTLTLSNTSNSFSGAITVADGVLSISNELHLGATSSTADLTLNGGTLRIAGADVTVATSARNLLLGASGGTIDTVNNLLWDNGISGAGALNKTGTGSLTLQTATTFTGPLNINAGSVILAGGNDRINDSVAVTVANGATFDLNTRSDTIGSLAGAGTVTNSGATASTLTFGGLNSDTTFSGTITDATGALNLVKQGTGRTILSGTNSFDGTTTVNAGVLNLQNASALGSIAGGTTVAAGAALELQHGSGISLGAEALNLSGTGVSANGALRNISGANSLTGTITLGAATEIQADAGSLTLAAITATNQNLTLDTASGATITLGGAITTGSGTVTKNGTGTAILSAANTYTGATAVNAGTLEIRNATALGTGAGATTISSGATLAVSNSITSTELLSAAGTGVGNAGAIRSLSGTNTLSGAVTLTGEASIGVDANSLTLSGAIGGGFGLTKIGAGNLTLSGANTYTGTTAVNAGTLTVSGTGTLGGGSAATTISNGASLAFSNLSATLAENVTATGTGVGGAGAIQNVAGTNTLNGVVSLTGATTVGVAAGSLTFAGNVTGGYDLVKSGAGNLTLSGTANAYTGTTTVRNGSLTVTTNAPVSANGALGNSGSTVQLGDSGTAAADNLALLIGNAAGGLSVDRAVSVNNFNASGTSTLGGTNTSGTNTFAGNIGLGRDTTLAAATGGTVAFSGALSGTGPVTTGNATSTGTVVLAGNNTYTGATTVSFGTLVAANNNALGTTGNGTTVASGATLGLQGGIALASGETLSVAGTGVGNAGAIRNVSGDNSIGGPVTVTADTTIGSTAGTLTLSGALSESGGARNLATAGAGNLVLTASSNLTGTVTIGGTGTTTLANTGGQVFGSVSGLTINSGATLALGAANQINDNANLTLSGGTFNVGSFNESMRQLSQTSGSFIDYLNDGSVLRFNGVTGSVSGLGTVTGTLTINNWAGSLDGGGTEQLVVYSNTGVPTVTNITFADWGAATTVTRTDLGSGFFEIVPQITGTYWDVNGSGNWNSASWANNTTASGVTIASAANTIAILGDTISSVSPTVFAPLTTDPTITMNTNRTIGKLVFENSANRNYTLSGASRLDFDVTAGQAQIIVNDNGAHVIGTTAASRVNDSLLITNNSDAAVGLDINTGLQLRASDIDITFNGSGTTRLDGAITLSGGWTGNDLIKTGSGTLILSGTNAYTGTTTLRSGTLVVEANAPSGASGTLGNATSAIIVNDAATTGAMTTNLLTGASGVTVGRNIAVGAQGAGTTLGGNHTTGTSTFAGNISLDRSIDLTAAGTSTVTFSGQISTTSGTTNLTKVGAGTVILSNATNSYNGATDVNVGTLRLGAAGAVPNTSAVTVASGATFDLNGFTETIGSLAGSGNVTGTSGTPTLTTGQNNASTTFSGIISDSAGTLALTKTGTGTFTLTGANTYDGLTSVSAGTLVAANNTALGTATGATTVTAGATLALQGGITITGETMTLNSNSSAPASAALANLGGTNVSTGAITLTAATANDAVKIDVAAGSQLTLSGAIGQGANTAVLSKSGTGTLVLSGTNTYAGATNVAAGTLVVASNGALGSTAAGTAVQIGATLGVQNNVIVAAGETYTLAGTTNPPSAPSLKNIADTNTLEGNISLTGGVNTGVAIDANTGTLTLNGVIAQAANPNFIVKTGSADLVLGGSAGNTFSGGLTINDGRIIAGKTTGDATGAGNVNIGDGIGAAASAILRLDAANQINDASAVSIATDGQLNVQSFNDSIGALTLGGGSVTGTGTVTLGNTLTFNGVGSSTATISANVNLGTANLSGGNRTFQIGNNGVSNDSDLTISGTISGTAGLVKSDLGTLQLSGTSANTNSGTFQVADGTVLLNKTAGLNATGTGNVIVGDGVGAAGSATLRLLASNQISDTSRVTVFGDGKFEVNGLTETIGSFAGTGRIDTGTGGTLIAGGDNTSTTFGGTLAGTGMIQKVGTGDLTFNASMSYAGELRLSGGELTLAGINLTVGTLRITGNTILDFGASAASTLTATNVIIDPGATLTITNWVDLQDYFYATGSFQQFGGPTAVFNSRNTIPQNQIVFQGWTAADTTWQSWDRQITPAPEPATYGAIFASGALALFGFRRWRQRKSATAPTA